MCGRYTLHQSAAELKQRYNLATQPEDIHANFNVAPGQFMPIITETEPGKPQLEIMKWGLIPFWAKDARIGYKMINARSESLFEKPAWRKAILSRRCLIPADGFYEWQKSTEDAKERKKPFYIHPKQLSICSFAGVWETWKDEQGNEWKTYSIITTDANKEMAGVHDRMPLILHQEDEPTWLEPSRATRDSIEPLLRPLEDNSLEMYEVSAAVNSPMNNSEKLLVPVGS